MVPIFQNYFLSLCLLLPLAISFFLVYRTSRVFDVFQGSLVLISAYVFQSIAVIGVSLPTASVMTVVLVLPIGLVSSWLISRIPISEGRPLYALLFSLGLYAIAESILAIVFGNRISRVDFTGSTYEIILIISFLSTVAITFVWYKTSLGLIGRAISSSPVLSGIHNISPKRFQVIFGGIASVFASIAGLLYSFDTGVTPSIGLTLLLPGILAVLLGARQGLLGVFLAVNLVVLLQTVFDYFFSNSLPSILFYLLILIFFLLFPKGLIVDNSRKDIG